MLNPSRVEDLTALLRLVEQARYAIAQEHTAAISVMDVDLTVPTLTVPFVKALRGYGLVMPAFGQPAGASLDVRIDGVPVTFQPGAKVLTPFQRIEVFNTVSGANTGTARFYILTQPFADVQLGQLGSGNLQATAYAAVYNSTVTIPTLATDGVSLVNGHGVRAVVAAPAGQTITSGLGVWWLFDDITGLWAESLIQQDLARTTVRRAVAVPDEFVQVGRGRAYLEVRSLIHSGGAGNGTVSLFGN